jgi:FMN reductase
VSGSPRLQPRSAKLLDHVVADLAVAGHHTAHLRIFDLLPQYALRGKTVLPLATGGSMAHALALDYALRPVLQSMGACHVAHGFLVVDRFIESDGPDGVTTISGDALPGLTDVVSGFRRAPAQDAVQLSA